MSQFVLGEGFQGNCVVKLRRKVYKGKFDRNNFRKVMHRIFIEGVQTKMFVRTPCEMMYLKINNSNSTNVTVRVCLKVSSSISISTSRV